MARNDIESQIRARVDSFVDDLSDLIRSAALEAVNEALGQQAVAAARARKPAGRVAKPAARAAKPGGKRVRRSAADLEKLGNAVLAAVKQKPGQRMEHLSKALGVTSKDLKRPIDLLVAAKQLRTEGQRRGTQYYPAGGGGGGGGRKAAPKKRKTRRKAAKKK